jgi:hypothetical protein
MNLFNRLAFGSYAPDRMEEKMDLRIIARFRKLAIVLLDDDEGINETAYNLLYELLTDTGQLQDFLHCIKSVDGRFYIEKKTAERLRS